jgi:hypothetical protein
MATKTLSMSDVYRRYKPRILGLLDEVRATFEEAGYRLDEPFEMSDEEYQWRLDGGPEPRNPNISVRITIIESRVRDGEDDHGINFSLDIPGKHGEVLGGYTPYNYRPEVWANRKDPSAIEARWRSFEAVCAPSAIVDTVRERRGPRCRSLVPCTRSCMAPSVD